jgi:hypothetical protein
MPATVQSVSPRRFAINPAHAACSTGPGTPQGKPRTAQPSRNHGFTAADLAVIRPEELHAAVRRTAGRAAVYHPATSQDLFAIKPIALVQPGRVPRPRPRLRKSNSSYLFRHRPAPPECFNRPLQAPDPITAIKNTKRTEFMDLTARNNTLYVSKNEPYRRPAAKPSAGADNGPRFSAIRPRKPHHPTTEAFMTSTAAAPPERPRTVYPHSGSSPTPPHRKLGSTPSVPFALTSI